ncbi:homeodomain-like protein [Tanacetum coccineum]
MKLLIPTKKLSGNLQNSTKIKPRGNDETISTSVKADKPSILLKRPKGIIENVLVGIDKFTIPVEFTILDILEDFKTPLILRRPFLSTAYAIINVFKAKITLSIGNDKNFFKSNKPTSNIIKRVYALSLIKIMELDNRSHDPKFEDYIELSDLNEPLELRHDQVVDLGPTIKEGEVIDTPIKEMVKTRHDDEIINGIEDYSSFSDLDRKIHVNDAYNLRFFCMIGKSVVGAFMNAPIFVGTFSVVIDFAVIKDMDRYRDEEMGDIIVGKEFCKEIRVSARDVMEGISHPYQKLKKLYKGVLNLGQEYIKDEKVEELLTRGHVSMHEME